MLMTLTCGILWFPGLFHLFKVALRSRCRHWSDADVVVVSERLMAATHAIMATSAGVIILTSCSGNVMTDSHRLSTDFVWFGAPYMAFDVYAMYLCHYHRGRARGEASYQDHSLHTVKSYLHHDLLLVIHHVALLIVFMPIALYWRRGLGDFFLGCLLTTEFSSPFIALGGVLIQLKQQDCWLHKANGLMVLLSFFTCRILLFPFMYWQYGRSVQVPFLRVPFHIPLHCNVGMLTILAPQLYWFALLCRKAHRLYHRQATPRDSDKKRL